MQDVLGEAGQRRRFRASRFATSPETRLDNFLGGPYVLPAAPPHILIPHNTMSDKPVAPPAENAASAAVENVAAKAAAAPKALPEQNAAFRMMGKCIARPIAQAANMRVECIRTNNGNS